MDANTKKRYDKAGPQVVKALEKRHFEAYYVSTAAEAVEKVVELIQDQALVKQIVETKEKDTVCQLLKEKLL